MLKLFCTLAVHASNLTGLKLEAIEREKGAVRRAREEGDASLMAEREASEEAMQHLGLEEEDRVRRKLKQAEKSWERQRTLLEAQVRNEFFGLKRFAPHLYRVVDLPWNCGRQKVEPRS